MPERSTALTVDSACNSQYVSRIGLDTVKPEQQEVINGLVQQRDVFAVLPTGFGKTMCFASLPLIHKNLNPSHDRSIVLVVTPLTAIIKSQVKCLVSYFVAVIVTSVT